jgi:hypothetical protein
MSGESLDLVVSFARHEIISLLLSKLLNLLTDPMVPLAVPLLEYSYVLTASYHGSD